MARVLIVEDDVSFADTIEADLRGADDGISVVRASHAQAGLDALGDGPFDLVICDLRIPRDGGPGSAEAKHGEAFFQATRKAAPGLPILFLSAFLTHDLYERVFHEHGDRFDLFGDNRQRPLVHCFSKERLGEALAVAREFVEQVSALKAIEVAGASGPLDITPRQKRVLRIFARHLDGSVVRVSKLSGGLSGSMTLQVTVKDDADSDRAVAVAKIDEVKRLRSEIDGYDRHVAPLSKVSTYAPRSWIVNAGAFDTGGVFYMIAADHDRSLFDVLSESDERAVKVVSYLRNAQEPWRKASRAEKSTVLAIRKLFVNNKFVADKSEALLAVPTKEAEAVSLQVRRAPQHGDLHGLNVLVNRDGEPLLIDYDAVGNSTACRDALTLEFGLLFHPEGAKVRGDWPDPERASNWCEPDKYLEGCPVPSFIQACRAWAYEVAAGEAQVLATAYSLAIQALRFPYVDPKIAASIASSAASRLLGRS